MAKYRVEQQSGFILHRRPFSESSLLVDVFTREYGRLTLMAKGSRRAKSRITGLFIPFKPLLLSWGGRGELPVLTGIESLQHYLNLDYIGRSCGYYKNELLLKLLHRYDSHEILFDKYEESLFALMKRQNPFTVLRIFEKYLLQETGFGLILDREVETGEAINPGGYYNYHPLRGPVYTPKTDPLAVSGQTLIALHTEIFETELQHKEARWLNRMLINIQLNGKTLSTRRVAESMRHFMERVLS